MFVPLVVQDLSHLHTVQVHDVLQEFDHAVMRQTCRDMLLTPVPEVYLVCDRDLKGMVLEESLVQVCVALVPAPQLTERGPG